MNSNGVIPGEAAACVLVERSEAEPKQVCVARVVGLGFAQEKAPILSEDPLLGLGLTEAARSALAEAQLPMHEIDYRLSDVTGESYGFKEQALMLSRLLKVRRECLPIWQCADSIGETGAAAGVCQLVAAVHAWRKRYAPGKRAICCTSAVPGYRAVAVLQREVFKDAAHDGSAATSPPEGTWSRSS
jgi:3-oxoacyl-[acyl-carrier-protein] synthase-1